MPFYSAAEDYSRVDWDGFCDHLRDTLQLVLFNRSNNSSAIDVNMDGSLLEVNPLLRCGNSFSLLNWKVALKFSLLLKLPPRKLQPRFVL